MSAFWPDSHLHGSFLFTLFCRGYSSPETMITSMSTWQLFLNVYSGLFNFFIFFKRPTFWMLTEALTWKCVSFRSLLRRHLKLHFQLSFFCRHFTDIRRWVTFYGPTFSSYNTYQQTKEGLILAARHGSGPLWIHLFSFGSESLGLAKTLEKCEISHKVA